MMIGEWKRITDCGIFSIHHSSFIISEREEVMTAEVQQNGMMRCMPWRGVEGTSPEMLLSREWLVTNGLGGYSSSTVVGVPTRSYHGLLIAALHAPLGRMLVLGSVSEQVRLSNGDT